MIADNGLQCSTSRTGGVWEFKLVRASGLNDPGDHSKAQNAAMKRFFSSLKTDRVGKKRLLHR